MDEAIIFIPGSRKNQKGSALNSLIEGLKNCQELARLGEFTDIAIGGHKGKSVNANFFNGGGKRFDLYEAYWNDLTFPLEEGNALKKFFKATAVLYYWFASKVWFGITKSATLTLSSLFTILILLCWYFGILLIAIAALQHETAINSFEVLKPVISWLVKKGESWELLSG